MELNLSATSWQQLVEQTTASLVKVLQDQELESTPISYVKNMHDLTEGAEEARHLATG